jgi:single-strand DNA-binding protein
MLGVNKVILMGHLGKDPELRYTPAGQATASFSLATTEKWTDKNGQRQERTEWHNIVTWAKTAELANQYLKKGSPVYIEGRINYRSWDDKDGNKKYKTDIVANQINFLSMGAGGTQKEGYGGGQDAAPRSNNTAETMPQMPQDQGSVPDEELPF